MLKSIFDRAPGRKLAPNVYNAERENGIRLATYGTGKRMTVALRIGRELATKAGIAKGDRVDLAEHPSGKGEIVMVRVKAPKGRSLIYEQSGGLVLKFLWREGLPSVAESVMCKDVRLDKALGGVVFRWPDEAVFDRPAKEAKPKPTKEVKAQKKTNAAHCAEPIYQEHRRLVEINNAAKPERRSNMYGRRSTDRKDH